MTQAPKVFFQPSGLCYVERRSYNPYSPLPSSVSIEICETHGTSFYQALTPTGLSLIPHPLFSPSLSTGMRGMGSSCYSTRAFHRMLNVRSLQGLHQKPQKRCRHPISTCIYDNVFVIGKNNRFSQCDE